MGEPQASLENKGESVLQWEKEGSQRGPSEQMFIGGKREFEVVAASHWLQAKTA